MNIILVIFDSLRKDCVGVYGSPPWGKVQTPHYDALARESLVMTRVYPESLPTLPARRAIYTGQRVYPFYNGDFRLKPNAAARRVGFKEIDVSACGMTDDFPERLKVARRSHGLAGLPKRRSGNG